jgi:hypothetical protein
MTPKAMRKRCLSLPSGLPFRAHPAAEHKRRFPTVRLYTQARGGFRITYALGDNLGNSIHSVNVSGTTQEQRRMVPRYSFIAAMDLIDSDSTMRLSGRISEISRYGCYVDVMNTLPVGSALNLRITRDKGTFATAAKTIYIHERIGMGVVFVDPAADQMQILDSWLAEMPAEAAL